VPLVVALVEEFRALNRVGKLRGFVAGSVESVGEHRGVENGLHKLRGVGDEPVAVDEARCAVGVAEIQADWDY
jgi:hypothetical protein